MPDGWALNHCLHIMPTPPVWLPGPPNTTTCLAVPSAFCGARTPPCHPQEKVGPGFKPAPAGGSQAGAKLSGEAEPAARQVGDALAGAASQATATAANVFLAEGGESQRDAVPPEVAAATAARTRPDETSSSLKED